jgi:hypothetical protein
MATFGNTNTYALFGYHFGIDEKSASKFTLSESALVSKISAYMRNTAGTATHKACIYTDVGGTPTNLVGGATAEVSVTVASGTSWQEFAYASAFTLSAGDYWLCITGGNATTASTEISFADASGNWSWNADTYADGPSEAWGTHNANTRMWSIYATYTVPDFTGLTVTKLLNG